MNSSSVDDSQSQLTTRDLLEIALHRHRVHDGFEPQRRALAVALDVAGVKPDDIDMLAESITHQRRKDSDGHAAILFALLKDPKQAVSRIADLRRGSNLRATSPVMPPLPSGYTAPTSPSAWDELDRERVVIALARGDRKSAEYISDLYNFDLTWVRSVIARTLVPNTTSKRRPVGKQA